MKTHKIWWIFSYVEIFAYVKRFGLLKACKLLNETEEMRKFLNSTFAGIALF